MTKSKPSHFKLEKVIRSNILSLTPYRCARDDYSEGILLDANENALGHSLPPTTGSNLLADATFDHLDLHRYPSPSHIPIKDLLCNLRKVPSPDNIFLGVGSDEVIDLLFRISCIPGKDRVVVCPPTYGMYGVCAQVNDVGVVKVNLNAEGGKFTPRVEEINRILREASTTENPIKLIFLCSPGNPTGTLIPLEDVRAVLSNPNYNGLVVVDEAYIDFSSDDKSAVRLLVDEGWENLVIMQTLSKGFGLAAIRLGVAYSSPALIQILNNIKAPYNISTPTATLAERALSPSGISLLNATLSTLISNHSYLQAGLLKLPNVLRILGGGHANFILTQIGDGPGGKPDNARALRVYEKMAREEKVVVRFRGMEFGCEGCLRITVGTKEECDQVLIKLGELLKD